MNKFKFLPLLAAGAAFVGCNDFDYGVTADTFKQKEYAENFEKVFGTPDPNQDWSMAMLVEANVNLPEIKGTAKMNICTGDPRNSETRLLAQVMLQDGQAHLQFDAIKGHNTVFITVEQDNAYVIFGQYSIEDGMLNVGDFGTRAAVPGTDFSSTCPTTLNDKVEDFFTINGTLGGTEQTGWFFQWDSPQDNGGPYDTFSECVQGAIDYGVAHGWGDEAGVASWLNGISKVDGEWTGSNPKIFYDTRNVGGTPHTFHVNLQYLDKVETVAATPWTRGYGYSLYGPKAFFQEQQYYWGKGEKTEDKYNYLYGSTEAEKLAMLAQIEEGFKIKTKGGVIELPFIYGATQKIDQFGYVFYTDDQDPLDQPHYVLMEDGRPDVNVYQNAWGSGTVTGFNGTSISTWVEGLSSAIAAKDNAPTCYCNPGQGIWKEPYGTGTSQSPKNGIHESWCTINNPGGTCNCDLDREGDGIYSSAGKHASGCKDPFVEYTNAYNEKVYGTTYRMVYFDSEGKATYDIPAGLNVVFFICPVDKVANLTSRDGYMKGDFHYSDPKLNQRISHFYGNTASPSYNNDASPLKQTATSGAVKACSWFDGTHHYLGFEDGGRDEDLNDIIFWVDGAFETTTTNPDVQVAPIKWHLNNSGSHKTDDSDLFYVESNKKIGDAYSQPSSNPKWEGHTFLGWSESPRGSVIAGSDEPGFITGVVPNGGKCYFAIWDSPTPGGDPEPMTWMFACEDLGGNFDYDFNDIVWEVQKTSDGTVQARLLAAGGTLGFTLNYESTKICTKAEVCASVKTVYESVTHNWVDVLTDANWTISENSGKFNVVVDGATSTVIQAPTTQAQHLDAVKPAVSPEVLLVPGGWAWPKEGHFICDAYPLFKNWTANSEQFGWVNEKVSEHTVK